MDAQAIGHYLEDREKDRLRYPAGQLEFLRTADLLTRLLPPPPADVLDVGGGPGDYSFWLADQGYRAHYLDIVPLHVEYVQSQPKYSGLASAGEGDALQLPQEDATMDAVLLMGPLYHLTSRSDRLKALREAWRVLRPGGIVFAIAISRFASAMDGLFSGLDAEAEFRDIVAQDLQDGQHRNPNNHPAYFTTAFFHHPYELSAEVLEAGFSEAKVRAIEGIGWQVPDLQTRLAHPDRRQHLMDLLRQMESEPTLIGVTAHMLCTGVKPA